LVGAGPGDPGLITVRGLECLRMAEVIVTDRLANPALLSHARPDARVVDAGKESGHHRLRQEEINALLVKEALAGHTVCRLKGGDPFVFGRGGEEALALVAHEIPFEIVPGVTSAVAAAAYAGIPVTERGMASALGIVTGHEDPAKTESSLNWQGLAQGLDTLVFLMGVSNLPAIVERLLAHGRMPETPVAVIHRGTTPHQRTVVGTLGDIVRKVEEAGLAAPAVIVVGEVVGLRDRLRWFDTRPLFGRRILVTRTRPQTSRLRDLLAAQGAEVIEAPLIAVEPMANGLTRCSWIQGAHGWCSPRSPASTSSSTNSQPPASMPARSGAPAWRRWAMPPSRLCSDTVSARTSSPPDSRRKRWATSCPATCRACASFSRAPSWGRRC
jgi:uroporphyrinogen III methyltransferase/synthase